MMDENSTKETSLKYIQTPSENLEGHVNIRCVQSSEFLIGKQTNFNGAVTLINCVADGPDGNSKIKSELHNEEKIIIRNEILFQSKPMTGQNPEKENNHDQLKVQNKVLNKLRKIFMIPAFICIGLVTAVVIAVTVIIMTPPSGEKVKNEKIGSHAFYTKRAWGGKPPRSTVEMKLPIPYAVVSHSVTTQCFHIKSCAPLIQNMQNYHLTLDFADISYNFLVDSSGNIYQGRGWNIRNVKGGFVNGRNIDIGLIGDYSESAHPPERLIDGLKSLLEFGVNNKKLSKTYSLIAANSTYSTLSPGINVYAIIKNWPHFDSDPKAHVKEFDD